MDKAEVEDRLTEALLSGAGTLGSVSNVDEHVEVVKKTDQRFFRPQSSLERSTMARTTYSCGWGAVMVLLVCRVVVEGWAPPPGPRGLSSWLAEQQASKELQRVRCAMNNPPRPRPTADRARCDRRRCDRHCHCRRYHLYHHHCHYHCHCHCHCH